MGDFRGTDLEPMLDMYLFESKQLLEQLENLVLTIEESGELTVESINEIFRIMHTLKGSAAMMMIDSIRDIAHAVEDVFAIIRNNPEMEMDNGQLSDMILESLDKIQGIIVLIENGQPHDVDVDEIRDRIRAIERQLKGGAPNEAPSASLEPEKKRFYITAQRNIPDGLTPYKICIRFTEGCEMENVRAFSLVHNLTEMAEELYHKPVNLIEDADSSQKIINDGLEVYMLSAVTEEEVKTIVDESLFIESCTISEMDDFYDEIKQFVVEKQKEAEVVKPPVSEKPAEQEASVAGKSQNMISVSLEKLNSLMNLVGEIVITESMVTQNPDLMGLELENFSKSARQLRKLTDELQDIVMDIRMVPITGLFQKMKRIVRDMSKKLDKGVMFETEGEDTEIDKSILDMLSDPMMHLIRNAMDHGIESMEEREACDKNPKGRLLLSAKNSGSDVVISIEDDGRGINREKVLEKARNQEILTKNEEEMSEREINALILHPGFSTKEQVSEFSGRGVGMDVVKKNIEKIGGTISIDSEEGRGTVIEMKIPLTLAIIDGMEVSVGKSRYTIPTTSIKESFRPEHANVITDPQGNELIMVRGECYPVVRMHSFFNTQPKKLELADGIVVMVENEEDEFCLFADELLGEHQVVVKPLPPYIYKFIGEIKGISGCTIMGNGDMSLIVDVSSF